LASDTGGSNSDGITNASTVNVGGLESGASWQYQIDGGSWVTGSGTSFTLSGGSHTYAVHQTDVAGNVSAASASKTYELDTSAPLAPTIGMVAGDDIINTSEQTSAITGTCEAGAKVSLSLGGNTREATVTGTSWSYNLTAADITAMGPGEETLSVTQTDVAGNVSAAATRSITISIAGQDSITLSTLGHLILPKQIEGNWYYVLDRNNDGAHTSVDSISYQQMARDYLGTTTLDNSRLINSSNRTNIVNGVTIKLPTLGTDFTDDSILTFGYQNGTTWSSLTPGASSDPNSNALYNDITAIYDFKESINGGQGNNGAPAGWFAANYFTSTRVFANDSSLYASHAMLDLSNGYISQSQDTNTFYVVFQVL
jgi:hypothetical protein